MRVPSALGVADEGADDAFLAAVAIALLQGAVLRRREAGSSGKAIGAAGIASVDREGRAIALHRGDHLAVGAGTLLERGGARRLFALEVVGKAVGTAAADRERAGGLGGRNRRKRDGGGERARRNPSEADHEGPSPEKRLILPAKRFDLVKTRDRSVKKSRPFDLGLDPDQSLRGIDIDQRPLADRHLGDRLTVAANEVAGTDVALDRHQVGEEAA